MSQLPKHYNNGSSTVTFTTGRDLSILVAHGDSSTRDELLHINNNCSCIDI